VVLNIIVIILTGVIFNFVEEMSMPIKRDKFDFEIGHLAESPCRHCIYRKQLPDCADKCRLIDKIKIILAKGISCSGTYYTQ